MHIITHMLSMLGFHIILMLLNSINTIKCASYQHIRLLLVFREREKDIFSRSERILYSNNVSIKD